MKKNHVLLKKNLFFRVRLSKRISTRLSRKFWFFKKYLYQNIIIKNFFLKFKKKYYFDFNLFLYFFYFNWLRCFSAKYYDIYLEDPFIFKLTLLPTLPKFSWHIGSLHKFFFFKSFFTLIFPIYFWLLSAKIKFNFFFLQFLYVKYILIVYTYMLKFILLLVLKKKILFICFFYESINHVPLGLGIVLLGYKWII